jgi:hypothetical protein
MSISCIRLFKGIPEDRCKYPYECPGFFFLIFREDEVTEPNFLDFLLVKACFVYGHFYGLVINVNGI